MAIQSIRLQKFRSYADESFEFESGVNIIVGPNGSGKTNLLEAILAIAIGSSYRAGDEDLIQFDETWARVDTNSPEHTRTIKITTENGRVQKNYVFDDKPYKILTHSQVLPVVLFEPNHLQLLHGPPELRRLYLDAILEQTLPGFITTRKHYRRALAQRNALLKSSRTPAKEQLFVWNLRLSELGGVIARERMRLVDDIQKVFPKFYNRIAGNRNTIASLEYRSKLPAGSYESGLLKALEDSYDQDIARGFTSYGPHRDDFVVLFNGRPAAEVASRGETRTALLALKIYELGMLEQKLRQKPILLLDDVFSELDGRRRHVLAGFLKTHQTFITTTDADLVLHKQLQSSHVIPISRTN